MQHKRIKKKKKGKTFIKNKKNCGILLSSCAKGSMLCNILISSFWLFFFKKTVSRVKSRSPFSERVCENIFDLLELHLRTQRRRSRGAVRNKHVATKSTDAEIESHFEILNFKVNTKSTERNQSLRSSSEGR